MVSLLSNLAATNPVLLGILLLGWLVPLVVGIIEIKRKRRLGPVLTLIGVLWAMPAIAGLLTAAAIHRGGSMPPTGYTVFDPAKQSGPQATLVIPWTGQGELEYSIGEKEYVTKATGGRYAVPAGKLLLTQFTASAGPADAAWQGQTQLFDMDELTVEAGKDVPLKVGPPYTMKVRARPPVAGQTVFEVNVTDAGGRKAAVSDANRQAPPELQLVDKRGKVVWQDKFAYG